MPETRVTLRLLALDEPTPEWCPDCQSMSAQTQHHLLIYTGLDRLDAYRASACSECRWCDPPPDSPVPEVPYREP